ncbi:MAG: hypothetical protein KBB55_02715, partial [Candidatus Buchananbacteria bacterium]|nr:hypothetical protein [Candidatus Buchananbacteria bacterium]
MTNKELIKQLKAVAATKQGGLVDAQWLQNNRQILMSQIAPQHSTVAPERSNYTTAFFGDLFGQRLLRPMLTSLIVVASFLGYTATSSMASASLPGDLLYPIKTTSEKVQLALAFDEEKKVNLQLDFIGRRTTELEQIVLQKDNTSAIQAGKVVAAVKQISSDVQSIKDNLEKLSSDADDASTVELAKAVDAKTLAVSESIAVSHNALPEGVKQDVATEVTTAITASESAGNAALGVIVTSYEADKST